jgi:ribosome maturation factor RimP
MKPAERDAVEREVRRLVEQSPYEIYDMRIGIDRSLHIYLDRRQGRLAVDEAARFNHFLRRELPACGIDVDAWSIEIESPGARRPLRKPAHYARAVGQRARIVRRDPAAPGRVVTGTLAAADEHGFRIEPEGGGAAIDLRYEDVADARLDPKLPF